VPKTRGSTRERRAPHVYLGTLDTLEEGDVVATTLRTSASLSILTFLCISVPLTAAVPLTVERYLSWEGVSDPQISPDGKHVVYTHSRVNAQDDRVDELLWLMDSNGEKARPLVKGSQATWSPDGSRIAYVSEDPSGGSKICVLRLDVQPSMATRITQSDSTIKDIRWSPDGKWLAFRAVVPFEAEEIELPGKPKNAKWTDDPDIIDRLHYRLDGEGLTPGYPHIFVVPAEGGAAQQITHGDWRAGANWSGVEFAAHAIDWTPDSRSIVFTGDMAADQDVAFRRALVHIVDISTRKLRTITKDAGFWGHTSPVVSPDGSAVAYVGHPPSDANFPSQQLRVAMLDGSREWPLIADASGYIYSVDWARDGSGVYFVTDRLGTRNLDFVSVRGAVRNVTEGSQVLAISSMSRNGIAVGTSAMEGRPAEIVRLNLKGRVKAQRLTNVGERWLADVELGKQEEIWYHSKDGTKVQGWVVYPPHFDRSKHYPLILAIHGGPEEAYDVGFDFSIQNFAANGFVVLRTNPRSSVGYGADFARGVDNDYMGTKDLDDLMSGVDAVLATRNVDENRLYVWGCSGGGALTNWIVTQTDRFAAAAAQCSISNWISMAGSMDLPAWAYRRFRPPFWQDPELWLKHSPVMYANKVKTPTLLMTGDKDRRTPLSQAEEFFTALKMNGVPTRLVVMKDEPHGVDSKPSNMLRSQIIVMDWFRRWDHKPASSSSPTSSTGR
jgi:dipeptidyl aminopeptidase/acylaminoacyl peptidase